MVTKSHDPNELTSGDQRELTALRRLVEGTATETGESFFTALVENLKQAMGTLGAWVSVYDEPRRVLHALSMKMRDNWIEDFTYSLEGTPCETAMDERRQVHIPERLLELYRADAALLRYGAVSYLGVPLFDSAGAIIGQLAVLDDRPMPADPRHIAIFQIFAHRAAAELSRLRAERAVREREAQLTRLLESAMDAIVMLDAELAVTLMNPAAERAFGDPGRTPIGRDFRDFLTLDARKRLLDCTRELSAPDRASRSLWIAGGLLACSGDGRSFRVEATLSQYQLDGRAWFTLILRDVEERLGAEAQIRSLLSETEYLRSELQSMQPFEPIVGSSRALMRTLHELEGVAATDTTVLLLGETGTGKELFARALHQGSKRQHKPSIKVNCGAIPANLIESELFGHERGAFTGATNRRVGRFALADGGTLFLDEIGELPLELQPKLLRVLQEGEFEPVGSSRTTKVDVRVIAATHRDLAARVREGAFREDLYYRLNVFPLRIPPLREREDDVLELARVFLDRFCRRFGRTLAPLSTASLERLRSYPWPGNVRELENVIERGVIISTRGVFDLARALPEAGTLEPRPTPPPDTSHILSESEFQALEKSNLVRALEASGWKVAGRGGAAERLQMNPSTLSSRMRVLGLRRPHERAPRPA